MSVLVTPFSPIKNREHKRLFTQEAREILPLLYSIEESFIDDLFNDECKMTYNSIFQIHVEMFEGVCERFAKEGKLKNTVVNKAIFRQLYKPQL